MNFIETKLPKEISAMCLKVTKAARRVHRSKNLTLNKGVWIRSSKTLCSIC